MLITVAVFGTILGSVIGQVQIFEDYHKCHVANPYSDCFNSNASGPPNDYRGYADLIYFYKHTVDCSDINKFIEHHTCVSAEQRRCITDIRWFTVRPTYDQFYEAFKYYCQNQIGESFNVTCYHDNHQAIQDCTELKSPLKIPVKFTFDEYKAHYCHHLDVENQCTIKTMTSCPNTAIIVVKFVNKLTPATCNPGAVISQEQTFRDFNKCHIQNSYYHCFNNHPGDSVNYTRYGHLSQFYLWDVACSAKIKFSEHHQCISATQRLCITDRRWFSMLPTSEQLDDAFTEYCKQQGISFNNTCYFDKLDDIDNCIKSKVSTRISLLSSFDQYKDPFCSYRRARYQCINETLMVCENTRRIVMEFYERLRPSGCIPTTTPGHATPATNTGFSYHIGTPGYSGIWGLQCSLLWLFVSLY